MQHKRVVESSLRPGEPWHLRTYTFKGHKFKAVRMVQTCKRANGSMGGLSKTSPSHKAKLALILGVFNITSDLFSFNSSLRRYQPIEERVKVIRGSLSHECEYGVLVQVLKT